jgi:hypothetical protein
MACHQLMVMGLAKADAGKTKHTVIIKSVNNFANFI